MHHRMGHLYRHLPSNTVYSVTAVDEFNYGFYTTDTYTMSPWVDSDADLDISVSNLESIEWQYVYDLKNQDEHCGHERVAFIGISGAGKTACLLCDKDL